MSFVLFRRLNYSSAPVTSQVAATFDESVVNAGAITDGDGTADGLGGGLYCPIYRSARIVSSPFQGLSLRPLDVAGSNIGSQHPYLIGTAAMAMPVGAIEVDTADGQFQQCGVGFQSVNFKPDRGEAINDHFGPFFHISYSSTSVVRVAYRTGTVAEDTVDGFRSATVQSAHIIAGAVGSPVAAATNVGFTAMPGNVPLTSRIEWLIGPAGERYARYVLFRRDSPFTVYLDFTFDTTTHGNLVTGVGSGRSWSHPCRPMVSCNGGSNYDGIREIRLYKWTGPENNRVYIRPSLVGNKLVGWFEDTPGFGLSPYSEVSMTGDGRQPGMEVITRCQRLERITVDYGGEAITTLTGSIKPDERGVATLRPMEPAVWSRNDAIEILVYPNPTGEWPLQYEVYRGSTVNNPVGSMTGHTKIGSTFTVLSNSAWPGVGGTSGNGFAKIVTDVPPTNEPYAYFLRCTDASGAIATAYAYGRLLNRPSIAGLPASNRLHVFHLGDSNSTGGDSTPPVAYGATSLEWRQRGELFGTMIEQLKILTGIHVVGHNYALSGQVTANIVPGQSTITNMVARIDSQVPTGEKFVVSISIGGNDATNGVATATYKANLKSLIDYLYAAYPNVVVVLHSMHLGTAGSSRVGLTWSDTTNYRLALQELARETQAKIGGLRMLEMQGFNLPREYLDYPNTSDGVIDNKHVGYDFLKECGRHCAERIFAALSPALAGGIARGRRARKRA